MKEKSKVFHIFVTVIMMIGAGGMVMMNGVGQNTFGQDGAVIKLKKIKTFNLAHRGYFSPDSSRLALEDTAEVRIFDLLKGKTICKFKSPDEERIFDIAFSKDWKMFSAEYFKEENTILKLKIVLVDTSTCREIKTLIYEKSEWITGDPSFSDDGRYLATVIDEPRIWEVESGKEVYRMTSLPEGYKSHGVLLSGDGKWLAVYAERFVPPHTYPAFYVVNLKTGEQKELNKDKVESFRFSKDAKSLVTVSYSGGGTRFRVYEVGSWKLIRNLKTSKSDTVFGISHDGQLLAAGSDGEEGKVRIYDFKTGKVLAEKYHYKRTFWDDLMGAQGLVSMIAHIEFSPDGKMLTTGGGDGRVKLWRIEKKKGE